MTLPDGWPRLALRSDAGSAFNILAERYLREYLDKIELAVAGLDEAAMWQRSGPGTNSIANLILHLCGNLSLWVLAGLDGQLFVRDRAAEFTAKETVDKGELMARLGTVVGESRRVIASLDAGRMDAALDVQGYRTDGRGVVFHVVEHMSYHCGQIVVLAKQAPSSASSLEFYPHHSGE